MKRYRNLSLALALALTSGLVLAQAAPATINGDDNGCNQMGLNMPASGDNGNCRNNVSGSVNSTNTQTANNSTGSNTNTMTGGANTAQGGSSTSNAQGGSGGAGGLSQAAVNSTTNNVNANRSSFVQTPNSTMAAVTSNSGNMVVMTTACGPRVHIGHEHVKGTFFTLVSGQESVDLGKHDIVRPAQDGSVFTEQRVESAKTTLLIGHQVSLSCTRVAVAGQRGFGIGGSSSGGSGALGIQNGGLMETMMCKAAVSGCVAATLVDPEPKPVKPVDPPKPPVVEPPKPVVKPDHKRHHHHRHHHNTGERGCQAQIKKTGMVFDTCGDSISKTARLI